MRTAIFVSLCVLACSPSATPPSAPTQGATYALVVSFGSECCGTDQAAERALEGVVARYPQAALGHTRGYWGKEGETDECFTLAGLDATTRARFVSEVRTGVARKLVHVDENAACRSDR